MPRTSHHVVSILCLSFLPFERAAELPSRYRVFSLFHRYRHLPIWRPLRTSTQSFPPNYFKGQQQQSQTSPLTLVIFPNSCLLEIATTTIFEVSTTDSFSLPFPPSKYSLHLVSPTLEISIKIRLKKLWHLLASLPQHCPSLTLIKKKEVLLPS